MEDRRTLNQGPLLAVIVIALVIAAMALSSCSNYNSKTTKTYFPNARYTMTDVEYGALTTVLTREEILLVHGNVADAFLHSSDAIDIEVMPPERAAYLGLSLGGGTKDIEDSIMVVEGKVNRPVGSTDIEFETDRGRVVVSMAEEGNGFATSGKTIRLVCFDATLYSTGFVAMTRCRTAELAFSRMFEAFREAIAGVLQGKDTNMIAIKPYITLAVGVGRRLKSDSRCDPENYSLAECWSSMNAITFKDGELLKVERELKALGVKL